MPLVKASKKLIKFDPKTFLSTINGGRKIEAFSKRQTIFAQGDSSDAVFYIKDGKIKLTVVSEIGKKATIGLLKEGNFFGEGCLTDLTTPGGRAFMHKLGGAAGDEIADSYVKMLAATNVTGYPYVKASPHSQSGGEDAPLGVRVDNTKLLDLNAYLVSLQAPAGAHIDAKAASHGRELFRTSGCTACHNVDQRKPGPAFIVPMKTIFPGDNPKILAQREPPLNPVEDTPGVFFDDKMAVVNASLRGEKRDIALPLLLDLARKPVFLHVPAKVEKAVATQSQGAVIRGFSQEKEHGRVYYEAQMIVDGHSKDVLFDAKGDVVEIEEQVTLDSLPVAVKDGLQAKAGKGTVTRVESLVKQGKLVAYEAQITANGKGSEVQVSPEGRPLDHAE